MSRTSLLQDLLATIASRTGLIGEDREDRLELPEIARLCHELISSRGEASGVRIATELLQSFRRMDEEEAKGFFDTLADEFSPSAEDLREAAQDYAENPTFEALFKLQRAAEPPRQELFRRLNLAPGGTSELVRMRERLLPLLKADSGRFAGVDDDFRHLFQSWFNRGFLILKSIDWNTPASILEKIIRYEAVHAIGDWDELRQRLQPSDRRCFAFFHPSIPDDPLIFVEVALTAAIPATIASVLDPGRKILEPVEASTAVFYSISNCHKGLVGISFGSFLIKQVAEDLKDQIPGLRTFVTLSPVPGFAAWRRGLDPEGLEPNERRALEIVSQPSWSSHSDKAEAARPGLLSLAARYFLLAKRRDGQPADPVARFHLGNGAMLNRIMHLADLSAAGLKQADGLMVNYLYDLPRIEQRHEAYAADREIAASRAVTSLLPSRAGQTPMREPA